MAKKKNYDPVSPSSSELKQQAKKGEKFIARLYAELTQYTAEAAVRMVSAGEYLEGISEKKFSHTDDESLRATVVAEHDLATAQLEAAKAACVALVPEADISSPAEKMPLNLGSLALSGRLN